MSEKNIENIQNMNKSDSNFAPTFVDHHLLLDITFNGDYLINDNISIPKKVINLFLLVLQFKVYTIMEATLSYLLMLQKYINSKQINKKIIWKKTGLGGFVKSFSFDFNPIDNDDILWYP